MSGALGERLGGPESERMSMGSGEQVGETGVGKVSRCAVGRAAARAGERARSGRASGWAGGWVGGRMDGRVGLPARREPCLTLRLPARSWKLLLNWPEKREEWD